MTESKERRMRTEDDLRAALRTLEQYAPTVDWALQVVHDPVSSRRSRRPRSARRLGWPRLAAAALTAMAVLAVALAVSARHSGSRIADAGPARLVAWTVQHTSGGAIKVTIRDLRDAAGLQAQLRTDGVPANVAFLPDSFTPSTGSGAIPPSCDAPQLSDKANASLQEKIITLGDASAISSAIISHGAVLVIHPSAIPAGIGVYIKAFAAADDTATGPVLALETGLVQVSPPCTGS